jgi:hypothetical protein
MKNILLLIFLLISINCFAQLGIFDSHYKEMHFPSTVRQSINGILDYLYHDKIISQYNTTFSTETTDVVVLKPFTDSVLFIVSSTAEKAKQSVTAFNFYDWCVSPTGLEFYLDEAVDNAQKGKTPLTDLYFLKNFPISPSNKQTIHDTNSYDIILEYNDLGLTLYFVNDILVRYEKS